MTTLRNFGPGLPIFLLWAILSIFLYAGDKKSPLDEAGQMVKITHAVGHTARAVWYEKGDEGWVQVSDEWQVTIGRNGLGKEKEGDGKTPVGVYRLHDVYGYGFVATKMPFFKSDEELLCVDDAESRYYDRIVDSRRVVKDFKSFERMKRADDLYAIVVTMGYNEEKVPGKGSCIFLHIRNGDQPTAGCIGFPKEALKKLVGWLDP